MRYIVLGAGAVGGVVGAKLAIHGHEVVLVARGAHRAAIQARGLLYRSPDGDQMVRTQTVGHPNEIACRDDDVVLLAVKSQDTVWALNDLRAAAGPHIPIFCLQNGVVNEREAARFFVNVYATLVLIPAVFLEPGIVESAFAPVSAVLDSGRYPAGADTRVEQVAADLDGAGLSCRPDPAVMRLKYAKLIANLPNALLAVCGYDTEVADIEQQLRDEAYACFAAAGIDCAPPGELRERSSRMGPRQMEGRKPNSTWQSFARGAGSQEADYLNGEIVLLGQLHGVATPANRAVQVVAQELSARGGKPGEIAPDALRDAIRRWTA